jgi:hypothetical protein
MEFGGDYWSLDSLSKLRIKTISYQFKENFMSTLEVFKAIQASEFSRFVGGQDHLFGAVFQLIHIVGLILVLSSVILVSLRLITIGEFANQSLIRLSDATAHLIWLGLGLLAFSGFFIFIPAATNYYPNSAFWAKFIFLALALLVHVTLYKKITSVDNPNKILARFTAVLVISLWLAVAFSARFIGFV